MESTPIIDDDEMLDVLRTCCARSTSATIVSNADPSVLSATFSSLSQDALTLGLHDTDRQIRIACPCYIAFFCEQARYLFTTTKPLSITWWLRSRKTRSLGAAWQAGLSSWNKPRRSALPLPATPVK